MPRGRKPSSEKSEEGLSRTTIFLPVTLSSNLASLALQTGESKATIVRQALAEYMKSMGYEPYQRANTDELRP